MGAVDVVPLIPIRGATVADCVALSREIGEEIGKTVPQVALNWVLRRPTVASVIIGARDEKQLRDNLGAVGWSLTPEQVKRLDEASTVTKTYPYWHQAQFAERSPTPV